MKSSVDIKLYASQVVLPKPDSHKGENGRVLVIGGSKLFHAASFWAASAASKIVDLVHFTSPAIENNDLMRVRAKEKFWDGIVIPWEQVEHYIDEDDTILVGPGMPRDEGLMEEEQATREIVNYLIAKYPKKRWVIDGGALQEIDVKLINKNMIVTPNRKELDILCSKVNLNDRNVSKLASKLNGATLVSKGAVDVITDGKKTVTIEGGNSGMTKGGTGDVLAGIIVGLYASTPVYPAAVVGAYVNKLGSETIFKRVGRYYSASDLIPEIQISLNTII